jgi:hypothetical protein
LEKKCNLLNNEIIELGFNINYYYLVFIFVIGYKNELNNKTDLDQKKFKYYKIIFKLLILLLILNRIQL